MSCATAEINSGFVSGFDVNAQDSAGKTPLHIACENGIKDNVKALLNFSIKVGDDLAPDEEGETTSVKDGPCCPRPVSRMSQTQSRDSMHSHGSHSMRDSSLHSLQSLQSQGSSPSVERTPSPEEGPGGPFFMHPICEFCYLVYTAAEQVSICISRITSIQSLGKLRKMSFFPVDEAFVSYFFHCII